MGSTTPEIVAGAMEELLMSTLECHCFGNFGETHCLEQEIFRI